MPHVSVHYKVYLPAGHHRQPRNADASQEPNPPSEVDVAVPGNITPLYIPQLPFLSNGAPALSQLIFWSVTDGVNGQTFPAGPLTQVVGSTPMTITAWYYPIGDGSGTGSFIIDDAFSAIAGDFINDDFVDVTSDPSLTANANITGIVPTQQPETLQARPSVASTTEPFNKWVTFMAGTAIGNIVNVPQNSTGIAIAFYERPARPPFRNIGDYGIVGTLVGGVAVDGDGGIIINGVFHHIDPWGPLIVSLVQASLITAGAQRFRGQFGLEATRVATAAVLDALRQAVPVIEKGEIAGRQNQ